MKIGVIGCAGRMGRAVMRAAAEAGARVVGGVEAEGHPQQAASLNELAAFDVGGGVVSNDVAALMRAADAVIEFTSPEASLAHAALASDLATPLVLGATGFTTEQRAALERAAAGAPVFWAANMSIGVNLALGLTERVAAALDADYDIDILEMHHRHKVDAPSGTALALGEAAARGRGVAFDDVARKSRDGVIGPRARGEIGFATLRGGDVVGDHHVIFAADGERFEIVHKASDRMVFARGAVRAARFLIGRSPGLYGMSDLLG